VIRKAGRLTFLIAIEAVSAVLIGLVVLAALFFWRLSTGPVKVDFLTPWIEQTLNDAETGVRVEIGDTVLNWGGSAQELDPGSFNFRAFDIRARDVRVHGRNGALIGAVPALGISFDMRQLILGHIQPTVLTLVRPELRLQRTADGIDVDIQTEDLAVEQGDVDPTAEVLKALQLPPGSQPGPLSRLTEVRIDGARLTLDDQVVHQVWRAPRADVTLRRDEGGLRGVARLDVVVGKRISRLNTDLTFRSGDGITVMRSRFDNIAPAELADRAPELRRLSALGIVLSGSAEVRLDRSFNPLDASLRVSGSDGELTLPEFYAEPLKLASVDLAGSFSSKERRVTIDEFKADLGGPTVSLKATAIDLGGRKLEVTGDVGAVNVPIDDLRRYWPLGVAPNPRNWITANLSAGHVNQAAAKAHALVDLDNPERSILKALETDIRVKGTSVRYFKELPQVTGVSGTVRISPTTLTVDAEGGQLLDMALGASKIVITGLDKKDQAIDIATPLSGPLRTALEVLNYKPLGFPDKLGLKPSAVGGSANAKLTFKFPLENNLTVDSVVFGAKGKVSDVSISGLIPRLPVTKGDADLTLDPQKLQITGKARVNGIPADISWMEAFSSKADILTRITARGEVGQADRERLGFPTQPYLTGPVQMDAVYSVAKPGQGRLAATFDLRDAAMAVEPLGWTKAPGMAGTAKGTLELAKGDALRLSGITIDTGGLKAAGGVELAGGGDTVASVAVSDLSLGETRASGTAVPLAGGGWRLQVSGRSLDARPLMDDGKGPGGEGKDVRKPADKPPLEINAQLSRVILGDGRMLRDVQATLKRDRTDWTEAQVEAKVGSAGSSPGSPAGSPMVLRYGPEGKGRRLVLETNDAGALLHALDLFDNIRGGRLTIVGRTDPAKPGSALAGRIEMNDYEAVNAPALARLLNAASPTGFAELVEGRSISFAKLTGEFRWEEALKKIWFKNVRTSGSALGLTMEGLVDVGADHAELQGTIVPVYGLNRLLGIIPLLGDIVTGGEGQGVFSATYRIEGKLNDPSISVNPLAVLAPGFLRNLFFLDHDPGVKKDPWVYEYPESN
jgi:hypothetical protein